MTATRFIPPARGRPAADPAHARWLAHAARHNPARLGDAVAAGQKQQFLQRLRAEPKRSAARAAVFRAMHEALDNVRGARAQELAALEEQSRAAVASAAEDAVLFDRTYPFPLIGRDAIESLRRDISARF